MNKVDLFLGGDMGLWALQNVSIDTVQQVLTLDEAIATVAQTRGLTVWTGDANLMDFVPSAIGVSVHYPRILSQGLISKYQKMYNFHPGYLPWGRGYYPIFWALWEQTPAGATLHEITERVDAGPIIDQIQVPHYSHDTGGALFQRVRNAEKELFLIYWPRIVEGVYLPSFPQQKVGSYHSKKAFFELKERIDWMSMSGKDLIELLRCLTFPGYVSLKVTLGQQEFQVRLEPLASTTLKPEE